MNQQPRNFLTIGMALLAILLCGYGIGFLLGEKKGRQQLAAISVTTPTVHDQKGPWVQGTLAKFDQDLQLSDLQKKQAIAEIEKTYDDIRRSRIQALREYSGHLVELHSRLLPHLDEVQRETLEESRSRLQDTLDLGIQ
jgi:hypothetical protein